MKWESDKNNPIFDGDVLFGKGFRTEDSKIVKEGNYYYMAIASGKDGNSMDIYMLKSSSLSGPWTKVQDEPIIRRGRFYDFDCRYLRIGGITFYQGSWYLYYSGQNLLGQDAVGVAMTSESDFPFEWKKYKGNPILKRIGNGWESQGIISLCIRRMGPKGKEWYGHYTAKGKDKRYHLGICYSTNPYGPFVRYSGNPILGPGEWDFIGPARADFIQMGDKIIGVYECATKKDRLYHIGGYQGKSIYGPFIKIFPDQPVLSGLEFGLQFANPHLWYENGKVYLFVGAKTIADTTPWWRYVYLFTLSD